MTAQLHVVVDLPDNVGDTRLTFAARQLQATVFGSAVKAVLVHPIKPQSRWERFCHALQGGDVRGQRELSL